MLRRYIALSETRPIVFNVANGVFLFSLGDYISQKVDLTKIIFGNRSKHALLTDYNSYQTFKMMIFAVMVSP